MVIFAATLAAVMLWAPHFAQVKEGLQAVVAAMGGLVGSIIGYYYGDDALTGTDGDGGPGKRAAT